jgi:hypothetical protein
MATNVNALVRNLGTEISAAYNPEKSTPTRMVFDYGGKEGLSTKQFMRKLKEIHPKAANAKDSTLGVAISSYQEIIRWIGEDDPTTRRLFEDILLVEARPARYVEIHHRLMDAIGDYREDAQA